MSRHRDRYRYDVKPRMPWADFIRRYDRPTTLFYLDPPYYGCERDYGDDTGRPLFARHEFEEMAELLGTLRGRFILSLNDHPDVHTIFAGFSIEEVETTYSIGGNDNAKKVGEVIISPG
jgi:DNA adenine methylase